MWKVIRWYQPKPPAPDEFVVDDATVARIEWDAIEALRDRDQPFVDAGGQRLDLVDVGVRDRDGALLLLIGGRESGSREMYVVMPDGIRPQ